MKVMLLTHYYPPEEGPPQRRWGALVARLTIDHEVLVLSPTPHYPVGRRIFPSYPAFDVGSTGAGEYGEHIVRLPYVPHGRGLGLRTLDQAVAGIAAMVVGIRHGLPRSRRPDVIVASAPALPMALAGYAVGVVLRRPVVLEFRDAWPDLIDHRKEWDASTTSIRWRPPARVGDALVRALTHVQRRCAAVVTTTESFAAVLRRRGVDRVVVIRNGPRPPGPGSDPVGAATAPQVGAATAPQVVTASPVAVTTAVEDETTPEAVPALRALADGPLRVVYLGTTGRAQGLDDVIRSVARAAELGVAVHLRIVGSGAAEGALRELAAQLGTPVEFLGHVQQSQVRDHYAWAHTAVVSLRDWKPLEWTVPSKLYELMQEGVYVTAVVRGEAAEIVRQTLVGSVVPPGDVEALAALWVTLSESGVPLPATDRSRAWLAEHTAYDALAGAYTALLQQVRIRRG